MTQLLDRAFETARTLPPEAQDEVARILLQWVGDDGPAIKLTAEERLALDLSKAAAARGEFATDEQVSAVWAKYER
jgi:hypothetical protein